MTRAAPVVLVAPSGAGKTTLAHRLVAASDRFVFSISATTRAPRGGEQDGVDYYFVSDDDFEAMIDAGELAEWATVHGRLYGTPRAALEAAALRGEHVVLDIDVQGARQIRDSVPDARLIFVLPPSVAVLMKRLTGRGTEGAGEVERRLRSALDELQAASEFEHRVVNDDLDRCLEQIEEIVTGEQTEALNAVPLENIDVLRAGIARVLAEEYENVSS
ncbi:MAG: guanylate kinase [Gemmatimonadota bacterium]|nr:guanylate kinase [Gemmatimonadota bacterium]HIC54623.1 guanylate kinase [Gemmatimonadota bacterium]